MTTTALLFGNLYLGNKMTNIPFFNAPWFDETAAKLRLIPGVESVFNPADEDRRRGFEPMSVPTGDITEAKLAGFVARDAMGADWNWIARLSNGMVIGPDWASSRGTISEIACHQALGLPVWEASNFFHLFDRGYDPALLFDDSLRWQFPALSNYLI